MEIETKLKYRVFVVSLERAWKYGNQDADQLIGYLRMQEHQVVSRFFSTHQVPEKIFLPTDGEFDFVVLFVTYANYTMYKSFAEKMKQEQPNTTIVFCGEYATCFYREMLRENSSVDYVILGDCEVPMAELLKNMTNQEFSHHAIASIHDTENKSQYINSSCDYMPAFDYYAQDTYIRNGRKLYSVQTKNNVCAGKCTFCIRKHGAIEYRPVSQVIDQIIYAYENFGIRHIFFTDNNLFDPNDECGKKHVVDLCNELQKLKERGYHLVYQCYMKSLSLEDTKEDQRILELMKKVGFVEVFVGIESANEEDLILFNKLTTVQDNYKILKMLNHAGLTPVMGFIGFHAYSTCDRIKNNFNFLVEHNWIFLSNYLYGFMDVHKYTKIYEILKEDHLIKDCENAYSYVEYDYFNPEVKPLMDYIKNELRPKLLKLKYETDTIIEMYQEYQVLYPNEINYDQELEQMRKQDLEVIEKYLGILFRDFDIPKFKMVENDFWNHFIHRQDDLKVICDKMMNRYTYSEALVFYAERLLRQEKHTINEIEMKKERCSDICAGYINSSTHKLWFAKAERLQHLNELSIQDTKKEKRVVIIIESPHKKEYLLEEPSPAFGITGENLQRLFGKLFVSLGMPQDTEDVYEVILMNSIQYQCSLGEDTSYYRDHIWLNMWYNEQLHKDFIKRLRKYDPDIIINCCTKGNHQNEENAPVKTTINNQYLNYCCSDVVEHPHERTTLRDIVWMEIDQSDIQAKKYECQHPSSWYGSGVPKVIEHTKKGEKKHER